LLLEGGYLLVVLSKDKHCCHEGSENLCEDIVWDLAPRKALPVCEAECDGWIEVAARGGSACDDRERNAESESLDQSEKPYCIEGSEALTHPV
jgi:hypothetical protein